MSEASLRQSIKDILDAVPGTGIVHDYERFTMNQRGYLEFFRDKKTGKFFGWEITRSGFKSDKAGQRNRVTHRFVLKGYFAIDDDKGSEKLFNAIIELIRQKLLITDIPGAEGYALPQSPHIKALTIGGVLCHFCEITLDVAEIDSTSAEPDETLSDWVMTNLEYYLQDPADDGVKDAEDTVTLTVP